MGHVALLDSAWCIITTILLVNLGGKQLLVDGNLFSSCFALFRQVIWQTVHHTFSYFEILIYDILRFS